MPSNRSRRVRTVLFIAFWIVQVLGECNAQSDRRQATPATYRVAGKVESAIDAHALARARVFLTDTKNPKNRQEATASEDGHFEFDQVAKGKFSLEGAKQGFISQAYNQHEQFSTAIVTGDDVPTDDLILRLMPAALISVKISDETSEPARRASVILYREDRALGVRRITPVMNASTDDLGLCEFTRLNPGAYFVGVTAAPWYALHPALSRKTDQDSSPISDMHSFDVVYPPIYNGGITEAESAVPIIIKGGDQTQVEIQLNPVPALHLMFHGTQNGQGGNFPTLQKVGFDGMDLPVMGETQSISPDSVEITGVAPGRYKVSLPGSAAQEMDLATDGQDLSEARGEALSTLRAIVRVLGEPKLPQPFFIILRPRDGRTSAIQEKVDEKGEANFANVSPGRYSFLAGSFTRDYTVVKVSNQDGGPLGSFLDIPAGSSLTVSLSLAGKAVSVQGFAKRGGKGMAGAMVVLVPKNPEANRELFRRDQSDLDGSFSLLEIVPGSYTVVAIEDGWNMDWALPAVIEPYLKNGQTVTISDRGGTMQLPVAVEVQAHH